MRHVAPRMENEVDVEEVGVRRPRREQVAAAREVVIGVVVVEPSTRVRSPAFERPAVDDRAGGVCRSIGSVGAGGEDRSEEHTSELQAQSNLVCRLLLEKKKRKVLLKHDSHVPPIERVWVPVVDNVQPLLPL